MISLKTADGSDGHEEGVLRDGPVLVQLVLLAHRLQ